MAATFLFQDTGELKKVFDQFDTNGDGKISLAELGGVLKAMGSACSSDELQRVMDDVDSDKDGFISLDDFASLCRTSSDELQRVMDDVDSDKDGFISLDDFASLCRTSSDAAAAASELKDAFDLYDENKNGLISSAELHQVLTRLGMSCSVDDCVKMIKSVDSDGDGCVNFDEFKQMMASKVKN